MIVLRPTETMGDFYSFFGINDALHATGLLDENKKIHEDVTGTLASGYEAVMDVITDVFDEFGNIPGIKEVCEQIADFARTSIGRIVIRALSTTLMPMVFGPFPLGMILQNIAPAMPGLMRGERIDKAFLSELIDAVKAVGGDAVEAAVNVAIEPLKAQVLTVLQDMIDVEAIAAQTGVALETAQRAVASVVPEYPLAGVDLLLKLPGFDRAQDAVRTFVASKLDPGMLARMCGPPVTVQIAQALINGITRTTNVTSTAMAERIDRETLKVKGPASFLKNILAEEAALAAYKARVEAAAKVAAAKLTLDTNKYRFLHSDFAKGEAAKRAELARVQARNAAIKSAVTSPPVLVGALALLAVGVAVVVKKRRSR